MAFDSKIRPAAPFLPVPSLWREWHESSWKDEVKKSQSEKDLERVGESNGSRGVRGSGNFGVQGPLSGIDLCCFAEVSTPSAAIAARVRLNTNCMKIEVTSRVIPDRIDD